MRPITRKQFDILDCTTIELSDYHRRELLPAVRRYFYDNRHKGFGDWDPNADDQAMFLYAYAKYAMVSQTAPATIARTEQDFERWQFRRKIPDYICSYYRKAIQASIVEGEAA